MTRLLTSSVGARREYDPAFNPSRAGTFFPARVLATKGAESAYDVAAAGGKHAGFLKNYLGRSPAEIDIERQIAKHEEAIANPTSKIPKLIKERALEAKREKEAAGGTDRYDYELGRLVALHEVVSLMQQQAEAFGLDLSAIALDDISPEVDLT